MRDTIVAAGPSAIGKTQVLNLLRIYAEELGISHVFKPLSDSHTILHHMDLDDERSGYNHYHEWCRGKPYHIHRHPEDVKKPFTVTSSVITDGMMDDFFRGLAGLPYDGKFHYAEWSGGRNINDDSEPAHGADVSFGRWARFLKEGSFTTEGLRRVIAVIHPQTPWEVREKLNQSRGIPEDEEIELGTASWQLSYEALRIFGEDDTSEVFPLLQAFEVPYIRTVENQGDHTLEREIRNVAGEVFSLWKEKESESGLGKERYP